MNASRRLTLNLVVGVIYQGVVLLANFLSKRVVYSQLGTDYLGLQTVYANICDVLVFASGGLGLAMVYRLYGAFNRGDVDCQIAVFHHFDALYRKVAWGALGIGTLAFVVVRWSVNAPIPLFEVAFDYVLYLLGVVIDVRYKLYYFFFMADQRRYVACIAFSLSEILFTLVGIALLYAGMPYAVFLACLLIKNVFIVVVFKVYGYRRYPYLRRACRTVRADWNGTGKGPAVSDVTRVGLDADTRAGIRRDVRELVMTQAGATLVSSTDSIIISGLVGTAVAGCYSGYYFIIAGITSVVGGIFEPLMSHVGKLQSRASKDAVFAAFVRMYGVCLCLTGVCVAGFWWLADDFVTLWLGGEVLLPRIVLAVCAVNLYMDLIRRNVSAFRLSAGLFMGVGRMTLVRGALNVAMSLMLGCAFGLIGILVATALSNLVTLYWYEPHVLYRYLGRSLGIEFAFQLAGTLLVMVCVAVGGLFAVWCGPCTSWMAFVVKALLVGGAACLPCLPVFAVCLLVASRV